MVHKNTRGGNSPPYELYVTDGTVNAQPTRNFHNVEATGIPPSAIFCLTLWEPPVPPHEVSAGDMYFLRNLRCKEYRGGGLELNWSNHVTVAQQEQGWRDRDARKVDTDDPRGKETDE